MLVGWPYGVLMATAHAAKGGLSAFSHDAPVARRRLRFLDWLLNDGLHPGLAPFWHDAGGLCLRYGEFASPFPVPRLVKERFHEGTLRSDLEALVERGVFERKKASRFNLYRIRPLSDWPEDVRLAREAWLGSGRA